MLYRTLPYIALGRTHFTFGAIVPWPRRRLTGEVLLQLKGSASR